MEKFLSPPGPGAYHTERDTIYSKMAKVKKKRKKRSKKDKLAKLEVFQLADGKLTSTLSQTLNFNPKTMNSGSGLLGPGSYDIRGDMIQKGFWKRPPNCGFDSSIEKFQGALQFGRGIVNTITKEDTTASSHPKAKSSRDKAIEAIKNTKSTEDSLKERFNEHGASMPPLIKVPPFSREAARFNLKNSYIQLKDTPGPGQYNVSQMKNHDQESIFFRSRSHRILKQRAPGIF